MRYANPKRIGTINRLPAGKQNHLGYMKKRDSFESNRLESNHCQHSHLDAIDRN